MSLKNLIVKCSMVLTVGVVGMSMASNMIYRMNPVPDGFTQTLSSEYYNAYTSTMDEAILPGETFTFTLGSYPGYSKDGVTMSPTSNLSVRLQSVSGPTAYFVASNGNLDESVGITYSGLNVESYTNWQITAPQEPGSYQTIIKGVQQSDNTGISMYQGLAINFIVKDVCAHATPQLALSLSSDCIIYKSQQIDLTATLTTEDSEAISGEAIDFKIGDEIIGTSYTDESGVATYPYNPSALSVGDYFVYASYAGTECEFNGALADASLSVKYLFLGFQRPIDASGESIFKGACVPVKIKIADANGEPVIDAAPALYFALETTTPTGITEEPESISNADEGNIMRYDAAADQYIFNWGIKDVANGTYSVKVSLGEGNCANTHLVTLSVAKKK